jgi:hypothetical protein
MTSPSRDLDDAQLDNTNKDSPLRHPSLVLKTSQELKESDRRSYHCLQEFLKQECPKEDGKQSPHLLASHQ